MELQFLTPTEVWEGFNPKKDPLETSITSTEIKDNIATSSVFFTSETRQDGKVRILARISYDTRWQDDRPAILALPSIDMRETLADVIPTLIGEGYVVCQVDYNGATDGELKSVFPPSLAYATYPNCQDNLMQITTSARETVWFEWSKVARRAISLLQETHPVDPTRIAIVGIGVGAQVAWQVAGMDNRISALIPINGGGYLWRLGAPRWTTDNVPSNDFERAFSTGVGAETYARFVTCPTCYIVASNSSTVDVDRAGDILSLVQSQNKSLLICRGTTGQITLKVFNAFIQWLKLNFAHDPLQPSSYPVLSFENIEGHLHLRLKNENHFRRSTIYLSYNEPNTAYRYWTPVESGQKVGLHEYTFSVPVYNPNELIVAYAAIVLKDDSTVCSPVISTIPAKIGVNDISAECETSRIIYKGDMGLSSFVASSKNAILDENTVATAVGPFNINGIQIKSGKLSFYRNSREEYSSKRDALLQFDAYSPNKKEIQIAITTHPNTAPFVTKTILTGGEFWQKISLSASDFKSPEGKTLALFADGKRFSFINAENVIFNNLLWI